MLNAIGSFSLDYDPERIVAYRSLFPHVLHTGILTKSLLWKENGEEDPGFIDKSKKYPLVFENPSEIFTSIAFLESYVPVPPLNNKGFRIYINQKSDKRSADSKASTAELDATTGGFLGLRPLVPPNDFLDKNEKSVVKALANVTLALSRGTNVEQILNESDPFSDVLFGSEGELDEQYPLRFLGLDVEQSEGVESDDDCALASSNIYLLAEKGFIKLSRQSSLAKLDAEFAESKAADDGTFGDDDPYYIELYRYDQKSGLALKATKSGKVLSLRQFEFPCDNTTDFETYKFHFPEFKPAKLTGGKVSWDENGKRVEEN